MRKRKLSLDQYENYYNYLYYSQNHEVNPTDQYRNSLKKFISLCIDTELTQIQKEILQEYIVNGKLMREIATERGIGISVVSRHVEKAKEAIRKRFVFFEAIYKICNQND